MIKLFLTMSLLMVGPFVERYEYTSLAPEIISVNTNLPDENEWIVVPEGTDTLSTDVEALNAETVLFWSAPIGEENEVWDERNLVGYDTKSEGNNNFSFTWKIPDNGDVNLLIQALGENKNVTSQFHIVSMP